MLLLESDSPFDDRDALLDIHLSKSVMFYSSHAKDGGGGGGKEPCQTKILGKKVKVGRSEFFFFLFLYFYYPQSLKMANRGLNEEKDVRSQRMAIVTFQKKKIYKHLQRLKKKS